jgi:hypothetical protein
MVVLVESVTLVVSVVLVELVPLHAANDKAINATKLNLMMFFMVFDELINNCLKMIDEIQADNGNTFNFVFNLFTLSGLQFRINSIK